MSSGRTTTGYNINWWRLGGAVLTSATSITIAVLVSQILSGLVALVITGVFALIGVVSMVLVLFVIGYEFVQRRRRINRWLESEKRRDSREYRE